MKRTTMAVALIGLLLLAGSALAQTGRSFDLSWHTVDGGGALNLTGLSDPSGFGFALGGTTGQPDAGLLSGGGMTLGGGFWGGGAAVLPPPGGYEVYLPVVQK